jgi:hypothetical protein
MVRGGDNSRRMFGEMGGPLARRGAIARDASPNRHDRLTQMGEGGGAQQVLARTSHPVGSLPSASLRVSSKKARSPATHSVSASPENVLVASSPGGAVGSTCSAQLIRGLGLAVSLAMGVVYFRITALARTGP